MQIFFLSLLRLYGYGNEQSHSGQKETCAQKTRIRRSIENKHPEPNTLEYDHLQDCRDVSKVSNQPSNVLVRLECPVENKVVQTLSQNKTNQFCLQAEQVHGSCQ